MAATQQPRPAPSRRVPPTPTYDQLHDPVLERQIVGACLVAPQTIPGIAEHVTEHDFYATQARDAWKVIRTLHTVQGEHLDQTLAADRLATRPGWTRSDAHAYLADCAVEVPVASNGPRYAARLHDIGRQRRYQVALQNALIDPGSPESVTHLANALAEYTGHTNGHHNLNGHDPTTGPSLDVETWDSFLARAQDHVATLVRDVWPEAAYGFIAGPPKSRKTWLALALALSVATGRPFLGRHAIPDPRPILYVALEGSRANLKQRAGSIARGLGVDPDTDPTLKANFAWAYKPPGINLADPAWAHELAQRADDHQAALVVIDVLRAGATVRENQAEDAALLRRNLDPILAAGRSIAFLHHFKKTTEITRDTAAGERMSGSGAFWGAADVGIYIAGHPRNPASRVEIQSRDLAETDPFAFHLAGDGSGPNGGYLYTDACHLEVDDPADPDPFPTGPNSSASRAAQARHDLAQQVADWLLADGGRVSADVIRAQFGIPRGGTWERLRNELANHRIVQLGRVPNITFEHLDATMEKA